MVEIDKFKVKELMAKKQIATLQELANSLGISKTQLSNILSDKFVPIKSNVIELAEFLGVNPLELIKDKNIKLEVGMVATKDNLKPIIDIMVNTLEASVGLRPQDDIFKEITSVSGASDGDAIKLAESLAKTMYFTSVGNESMGNMDDSMKKVYSANQLLDESVQVANKSTKEAIDIIHLIGNIANQTNLLALNAAIEAASIKDNATFLIFIPPIFFSCSIRFYLEPDKSVSYILYMT